MNIWLVRLVGGLITFGIRFSFIYLFGRFHIPETVRKAPSKVVSVSQQLSLQAAVNNYR